ncbi:MAG: lyase family protein [Betaproteobacteria bacterium]
MSGQLFERVLADPQAEAAFSDAAITGAMLQFEIALAAAQAELGLVPASAAAAIARHAGTFAVDPVQLARDGAHAGSLAIAFVGALTAHLARHDADAARHVHSGATSQDVLDTALVLCTRDALALFDGALHRAIAAAGALAQTHAATPLLARSFLQPAGVTTFGWKAAQWTLSLARCRARIAHAAGEALAVSLGGAIGNLAAQGQAGCALRRKLARALALADSGATWHTHRDDWIGLATAAAIAAGTMGKIAHDIALMAQSEVGEVAERAVPGRGGSTAMPHKRNPVLTMRVIAAVHAIPGMTATLLAAMSQEHERALGTWQAELAQWPGIFVHAASAARALAELLEGLEVDAARCRANIDRLDGVVFAERLVELFAPAIGKTQARTRITDLCRRAIDEHRPLQQLAREAASAGEPATTVADAAIAAVFDVDAAARASADLVEALLQAAHDLEKTHD